MTSILIVYGIRHFMHFLILLTFLTTLSALSNTYEIEDILFDKDENSFGESFQLDASQIESTEASSVDDILRLSSSATTTGGPRSSSEATQIRGLGADKTYIYIDGVKQNFRTDHSSMITVDFENLKKVIINKDSSDLSLNDSIGGGVLFETKDPSDILKPGEKKGWVFGIKNQSAANEKILNGQYIFRNNKSSGLVSSSFKESDDVKLNDGSTLDESSYKDHSLLVKYLFKDYKARYEFYHRDDESPLNPTLNPPASLMSLQGRSQTMKNTLSIEKRKMNYHFISSLSLVNVNKKRDSDKEEEQRDNLSLSSSIKVKKSKAQLGATVEFEKLNASGDNESINSYPKAESYKLDLFAQKKKRFKLLSIDYGIKGTAYKLSPSSGADEINDLGLGAKFKSQLEHKKNKVSLLLGHSFNAPKLNQVYPDGIHHYGDGFFIADNFFIPNEELKHEKVTSLEFSFEYADKLFSQLDLFSFGFSQYWRYAKDYIYFEKIDRAIIDGSPGTTQFINIDDVTLHGHDLDIAYAFSDFTVSLSYSHVRGYNNTRDLFLAELPADQITYSLDYELEKWGVNFGYLGLKAFDQNRVNPNTTERTDATNGYFVSSVYAKKKFLQQNLDFIIRVDNLGNTRYRRHGSNINEAKQDIRLGLKYYINTK